MNEKMQILSFDWATKRSLTVYDPGSGKTKQISNYIAAFEKFLAALKDPAIMLFEFGGGDTFKILAFRAGHYVLQIPGKKIKDYRDSEGIEKNDQIDAKIIYDFFIENEGKAAAIILRNFKDDMRLPSSNKKGRAVGTGLRNSKWGLRSPFYLFQESNAQIAEIKILFRTHEDLKKSMVREKNKLFAFDLQFRIARISDDRIEKIRLQKKASIVAKEKELKTLKNILEKKLEGFEIWTDHYKQIRGIGLTIMAGLIGELGGRQFEDDSNLKHYAGMVAKADHCDYNRYVKMILYQFAEQTIKRRIPEWRDLYDNMKIYYSKKHQDWKPGKIDNYAKKFIETKFLIEFWKKWRGESIKSQLRNSKRHIFSSLSPKKEN